MTPSLELIRAELKQAVATATPGISAANSLCRACVKLLGVDGAAVSVILEGNTRGTFGASSAAGRRLDEHQFTFGEGPCLDAAAQSEAVLVPDLESSPTRWPAFTGAALSDGIRSVFALPIIVPPVCIGVLDLFRSAPGPLHDDELAGALFAARLASLTLLDLLDPATGLLADPDGADPQATDHDYDHDHDLAPEEWAPVHEIDRVEVHQAVGMVIAQLDVDVTEALLRLRGHAIATNRTASQVAWDILQRTLVLERDDKYGPRRSD